MGTRGPLPKREREKLGHTKADRGIDHIPNDPGEILGPEPPDWMDGYALEVYHSLRESGQAVYYTASDWAVAAVVCRGIIEFMRRPAATIMGEVMAGLADLAATEGSRRRIKIELDRGDARDDDEDAGAEAAQNWASKLSGTGVTPITRSGAESASRQQVISPLDRLVTLPPGVPEFTLGYEAIRFITKYIRHPNGPSAGKRWQFVTSQAPWLLWWYALVPQPDLPSGKPVPPRWMFEHGVRRLAKGAGKSPIAGVMSVAEFCGPVRFDRWDADAPGGVLGKSVQMPLVQIAATAESQTANTMRVVRAILTKKSRLAADFDIEVGKTVIYCGHNNGQLEVITSSAAAEEGAEVTFAIEDETEHWKPNNGGNLLAGVLDRNLAKSNSRAVETCNAWEPGEETVAEQTYDAWIAQEEKRTTSESLILYDSRIAPPGTRLDDEKSLEFGISEAYGDCFWVDQRTIKGKVLSLRTDPDMARRYYLNQPQSSKTKWTTPQAWSVLAKPEQIIDDKDDIVAFFDGSRTQDATALVACHVETGHVSCIDVWEPAYLREGSNEKVPVPVQEVDDAVARMFDRWTVRGFFADVREWESFVRIEWPKRYAEQLSIMAVPSGKEPMAIAWDMRTHVYDFTMACELTWTEIDERGFSQDGDSRVARHIINAKRAPNRWGTSISKETPDSAKKIDAAVCVIGARMVRRLYLAGSQNADKPRTGRVSGFS